MDLGCGLFGLGFALDMNFWGTMKNLTDAGFTAVEPLLAFAGDPAMSQESSIPGFMKSILWDEPKLREYLPKLKELGLSVSSMHAGFLFGMSIEEGCRQMIELAENTGIIHFMTSLEFDSEEKVNHAIALMNESVRLLKGTEVTLGYHNHYQEFNKIVRKTDILLAASSEADCGLPLTRMNGAETYMDHFLANTDPAVKLQLDVGWEMYGNNDVISFMKKYGDRIQSVHLKDFIPDFANVPEDEAFAAIGDGVLPTKEILSLIPGLNLMEHGLMIDQDKAAVGMDLMDDLVKGAKYLRKIAQ